MKNLREVLKTQKIIVTCGTGGVGKTTTSAAIGLACAKAGRKVCVITIDPAKRLCTSLGIEKIPDTPLDLTDSFNETLKKSGKEALTGRFYAVMPDTSQTFTDLIKKLTRHDSQTMNRIFNTSIFKIFAQEFSGAHEYMAMEKLYDLSEKIIEGTYDVIILDTPPSASTELFLKAPSILSEFFDESLMKWFVNPGSKLLSFGLDKALDLLEKLTGKSFITDLIEFIRALFQIRNQFLANLKSVNQLLRSPDVSFLMVTTAERMTKPDTTSFVKLITEDEYPFHGFIVNRSYTKTLFTENKTANTLPEQSEIQNKLLENYNYYQRKIEKENRAISFLKEEFPDKPLCLIPEQKEDIHHVEALYEITQYLQ